MSRLLRETYPTQAAFRMMLYYSTNSRRLDDYGLGNDMQDVVFHLLDKANRNGWIPELLEAAINGVETPPEGLVKFAEKVQQPVVHQPLAPLPPAVALQLEREISKRRIFADLPTFLARLTETGRRVCRVDIVHNDGHTEGGTGFLIGADLVLTNYHVVASILNGKAAQDQCGCTFDFQTRDPDSHAVQAGTTVKLDAKWKIISRPFSKGDEQTPPTQPGAEELDYAVVRLSAAPDGNRGCFSLREQAPVVQKEDTVFIVQHPRPPPAGAQPPMQLGNGMILESPWAELRLRYDTTTHKGSSGSPVLDASLRLAGLHHAGDPASLNPGFNQGIPLNAIIADLAARRGDFTAQGVEAPV